MKVDCPDTTYDPQSIPREILPAARILSALDGNPLISSREFDIAQTLYLYKKLVSPSGSLSQIANSYLKNEQKDFVLRSCREAIVARRLDQILPGLYYNPQTQTISFVQDRTNLLAKRSLDFNITEVLSWFGIEACDSDDALRLLTTLEIQNGDERFLEKFALQDKIPTTSPYVIGNDLVGYKFPQELTARLLTGDQTESSVYPREASGKVVVIGFWATWCEPCIKERNVFAQIAPKLSDSVSFVNISVDEKADPPQNFLVNHLFPCASEFWDEDKKLQDFFHMNGVPAFIVISPDGTISSALNSTIASEPEDIEAGIRQIIKDAGP